MDKVGVIILNWNHADDTIKCINSLYKYVLSSDIKVLVIDNCSNHFDKIKLKKLRKSVEVIYNNSNVGYVKGINQGIRHFLDLKKSVDYVLLLNNDTYCDSDFLEPLIKTFNSYSNLGSVNPVINYYKPKGKVWFSKGIFNESEGLIYTESMIGTQMNPYLTDWTTGCANLIKTKVLIESGVFLEKLNMYVEDVEYSLRIKKTNYICMVNPKSKIYHRVSSTIGEKSGIKRYYITKNSIIVGISYSSSPLNFYVKSCIFNMKVGILSKNITNIIFTVKGIVDGTKYLIFRG